MTSFPKKKFRFDMPFTVALGTVLLILSLPIMLYILQQQQILKQHAQMTPPPVPPGCFYFQARCSETPTCNTSDPKCDWKPCNPSDFKIVCPDVTPVPSSATTISQKETTVSNPFFQLQQWFVGLFK